jgi:hypothetical protein
MLVIPAMDVVPTPQLVAALGCLPLVAATVLEPGRLARLVPAAAAVALPIVWSAPLELRYAKAYDEAEMRPIYERWTPTARLTFFDRLPFASLRDENPDQHQGFAWGTGMRATKSPVRQYWIEQDANAGTPITSFDGDLEKVSFLLYDVTTVGYQLRPPKRVAIIGAGGGRDILTARLTGAEQIDAVELNPHIVDLVSNRFGDVSGGVYQLEGVRAQVSEGRSFLTRSESRYDLIQISLIDSWAATAAGAFALSENNLYTLEAYRLYWSRLSDSGLLSTSRWMAGKAVLEMPRLIGLNRAALVSMAVPDPEAHLALVQGMRVGTVLLSKRPFSASEIARLRGISAERGFQLHHPLPPGEGAPIVQRSLREGPEFLNADGFEMTTPTDDRPFFFQVFPILKLPDRELIDRFSANAQSVYALQLLVVTLAVVALALFFAPFALARWMPARHGLWRGSGYFVAIGIAFMWVEVPWLQRFILFLGHPSYASTVVLASLLLGAGLGSLASARLGLGFLQRFGWLVPALVLAVDLALAPLFGATLGWVFPLRVALSALLLAPIGFLLGSFFPLGMLRFGDRNKAWFWAMNGAAGVLATAASLAGAMAFGFSRVAWAGVAAYALAVLLVRGDPEPLAVEAAAEGEAAAIE